MLAAQCLPVSALTSLNDVRGHWAEKAINNLIYSGTVNGYPDGSFKPDNKINADEFIVLVLGAAGYEPEPSGSDYWAQGYINQAVQKGILNSGYIDDFTRPITREEMCMLIVNAFLVEDEEDIFAPADEDQIDDKYLDYVKKAYNAKIVTGYEDNTFRPKEGLTRAEACQVIRQAQAYDPDAKLPYEYKLYDVADAALGEDGSPWKFYAAASSGNERDTYTQSSVILNEDNSVVVSPNGSSSQRPFATWNMDTVDDEGIYVYVESDAAAVGRQGNLIMEFTAPVGGNYLFDLECTNIGSDVIGGDGGTANMTFYGPNDNLDAASVGSVRIPVSSQNPQTVTLTQNVKLKRGQSVALRFGANVDGYGDRFKIKYTVETTQEEGKLYTNNGIKNYLAQPPEEKLSDAAPYREGLVWIGADGGWAASDWAEEVVEVLEKYIPNLGMILLTAKPEVNPKAEYYAAKGIPTFVQSFGDGDTYKYYSATDAWEYNWNFVAATPDSGFALANSGHSSALPHESVWEWVERLIQASVRSGYGGYGYMDYVWDWGMERGRAGYNPQTIAAFRKDLKGEDEGLWLSIDGESRLWHFEDFAKYYTGSMLTPQDVGLESWDEYMPLTYNEFLQNRDADHTQNNLLMDLLVTYEWLRLAQHMGVVADEEGGMAQVMPNPEDAANGGDFLFLSALDKIEMTSEEFFADTEYLDGAYYRFNYLTSKKSDNVSPGIVLEAGGGGNAGGYYDEPIAYAAAYELKAATDVTHIETDFMVQNSSPIASNAQDSFLKGRYQAIMSYARGFIDAQEDGVRRYDPDFVSVTSRKVNRPWGEVWHVWEWLLDWKANPDRLLAQNGYIFEGIGEDGVFDIEPGQEIVLYSPDRPNKYHFDHVIDSVQNGDFKKILTNGAAIEEIVDEKYNMQAMADVYPEYAFEKTEEAEISGNVTDNEGNVIAENISIESTTLYQNDEYEAVLSVGDIPVLVKKDEGAGEVYVYCLDPNEAVNYYLSKAVYDYVLENSGVEKQFETIEATGEYADGYEDWGALETRGKVFTQNASVRLYENGDLKVVGVQNPLSRNMVGKADRMEGKTIAYELKNAKTTIKARLEPDTEYHYVALPSGQKGSTVSDSEGMAEFSFENTGHEIFYCLPASTQNDVRISEIAARLLIWHDSLTYDGNITVEDVVAPATTVSVEGSCTDDVYTGSVDVNLSAVDTDHGSGVKRLEYSVDGGSFASVTNRSVVDGGYINKTVTLTQPGEHTISYRAVDERGNTEYTGTVTVNIK